MTSLNRRILLMSLFLMVTLSERVLLNYTVNINETLALKCRTKDDVHYHTNIEWTRGWMNLTSQRSYTHLNLGVCEFEGKWTAVIEQDFFNTSEDCSEGLVTERGPGQFLYTCTVESRHAAKKSIVFNVTVISTFNVSDLPPEHHDMSLESPGYPKDQKGGPTEPLLGAVPTTNIVKNLITHVTPVFSGQGENNTNTITSNAKCSTEGSTYVRDMAILGGSLMLVIVACAICLARRFLAALWSPFRSVNPSGIYVTTLPKFYESFLPGIYVTTLLGRPNLPIISSPSEELMTDIA